MALKSTGRITSKRFGLVLLACVIFAGVFTAQAEKRSQAKSPPGSAPAATSKILER
jgi:hypothetical protein